MKEIERTFLAKYIPEGLEECDVFEVIDKYIPKKSRHPVLRIRKKGDRMVLTKKKHLDENDASVSYEETIVLDKKEYDCVNLLDGKKLRKYRYIYDYNGIKAEFDVFLDDLKGLVLIDFEFESEEEMKNFKIPDFCLKDVTQEEFIAGGMLCGKNYSDIEENLKRFDYQKIDYCFIGQTAGGIIINDGLFIIVEERGNLYSFPKGGLKEGERNIDCAYREIYEETGIEKEELEYIQELGSVIRLSGNSKRPKEIHLFLFKTKKEDIKPIDKDNPCAFYLKFDEVKDKLTFKEDIGFFEKIRNNFNF